MAQHFLLSAKARTLSLKKVLRLSDDEAFDIFKKLRWADTDGEPYCPRCGCMGLYFIRVRKVWRCKACDKEFSVTSGTIFASRKLSLQDYLGAILLFVNSANSISALRLSRELCCDYKTAYVLLHKLMEVTGSGLPPGKVGGVVEVDGAHFGGHVRPTNWKENRKDRRLVENQKGTRQVVVVMRERGGRTLPYVFRSEDQSVEAIKAHVEPGSTVHADEAPHWDSLELKYKTQRINHGEVYSDGLACTNQAESYFARLRRAEIGVHHHIAGAHLEEYADSLAWREDHRRISNGAQHTMLSLAALRHPASQIWSGYWKRRESPATSTVTPTI